MELKEIAMETTEMTEKNGRIVYHKDKSYFRVPNRENSYWAGLIAADGNLYPQSNKLSLYLKQTYKDHVELFARAVGYDGPIVKMRKNESIFKSYSPLFGVQIYGVPEWLNDLAINFSVTSRKADRLPPPMNLDVDCAWAFIAGYFDGDGCINLSSAGRKRPYPNITFTSRSDDILLWVNDFINRNLHTTKPSKTSVHLGTNANPQYPNAKVFRYKLYGDRAVAFLNKLLELRLPYLKPKWSKYERYIEIGNSTADDFIRGEA